MNQDHQFSQIPLSFQVLSKVIWYVTYDDRKSWPKLLKKCKYLYCLFNRFRLDSKISILFLNVLKVNRSSHLRCSIKNVFLKGFANSQKTTCVGVFLNKVADLACNFIKKETPTQVFYCEFRKNFKSIFYVTPLCDCFWSFTTQNGQTYSIVWVCLTILWG